MVSLIDTAWRKPCPTREQISEITRLGESVGLTRSEIVAVIDAPLSNQKISNQDELSEFLRMMLYSILIFISII